MDHFHHRDGQLHCDGVPLAALAAEVGTPAWVYSLATVREHVHRLREAFRRLEPLVCYAVKANANLAVLETLLQAGCGFDIVSGGELRRLRTLGADPRKVVFSGVGKTEAEMEAGIGWGILAFNVESEEEAEVLAGVAARLGKRAGVALRVNPDVDPKTHRYISTGKRETKFGVDLERAEALGMRVLEHGSLELRGVQCHIGSQITSVDPYVAAVSRTLALAKRLASHAPTLAWLDMGGGFGIPYDDPHVPGFDAYAEAVGDLLDGSGLRLALEPGRVIVGNAGVLLTRVLYNKVSGDKRFVIVDAGMNDLIRPTLYGGHHRIWPVTGSPPPPLGEVPALPHADVVGPVCESGDFLAQDRPLPPVRRGDLLAVLSAGAYGAVMSSNYNERCRAPEIVVDGDRYGVARRRETYEDLVRPEVARPEYRRPGEAER